MNLEPMNILWVNISYYPAPGGAAIDLKLIGEALEERDDVNRLVVLAEAYPGQPAIEHGPGGKMEVRRIFPYRGGADKKNLSAYLKYSLQNVKLLQVPGLAKSIGASVVVFHSWYFIHPSLMALVIRRLRALSPETGRPTLVADMRDTALTPAQFNRLYEFDALVCCGERVVEHFKPDGRLADKLHYVPVPHVAVTPSTQDTSALLTRLDLRPREFIFTPSGISNDKRFPLIYDAWRKLLSHGAKLDLAVAGRNRDWQNRFAETQQNGRLVLTGSLNTKEIHSLYQTAALSLNPSDAYFEGLPRVPLEAVFHGRPLLFPPGIPEFAAAFPRELICDTSDPSRLAEQMQEAMAMTGINFEYDMQRHAPATIAAQFASVFRQDHVTPC